MEQVSSRQTGNDQARAVPDSADLAPRNSQNRFAHIDALRALAVVVVVIQHAGVTIVPGDSGVTVFFAISGFIITTVLMRERDKTGGFRVRRFYVRRALKLGPPFVVAILIPTLIYSIFQSVSWLAVLSQVFFSYNWVQIYANESSALILPGSNIVWSLAVEEQFYIGFAVVWIGFVKMRRWDVAVTAMALLLIVYATATRLLLIAQGDAPEHVLRGTDVRMDAIAWGVLAAVAFHRHRAGGLRWLSVLSRDWVPVVALVSFLVVSAVGSDRYESIWRHAVIPVATVGVIIYGLMPTGSRLQAPVYRVSTWKSVSLVGLASYSIYIAHYVVIYPLETTFAGVSLAVRAPAMVVVGLAVGILVYYVVEKPVFAFRERRGL